MALRRERVWNGRLVSLVLGPLLIAAACEGGSAAKPAESPLLDSSFFPIAVWLQNPSNAQAYRRANVNLYIGLWDGPTEEQLVTLSRAGMKVICVQNEVGLQHVKSPMIVAWMHDDEPDNAQPIPSGGYGPPVNPNHIKALYDSYKAKDPSRPVYLNLGQGVAWHNWIGRGPDTGTTHNYPRYAEGADILSFDIYPANTKDLAVHDKLAYVARGVSNLRRWSGYAKPVWCWIETTKISEESPAGPTPEQVKSEVWMALIHGAKGIGYFCHSWTPQVDDAALLHNPEMLNVVSSVNKEVQSLASVLNSATLEGEVTTATDCPDSPVDVMVKRYGGATYVFAISMGEKATTGSFKLKGAEGATVEVLSEGRKLKVDGDTFSDGFRPYAVHIYRIKG